MCELGKWVLPQTPAGDRYNRRPLPKDNRDLHGSIASEESATDPEPVRG